MLSLLVDIVVCSQSSTSPFCKADQLVPSLGNIFYLCTVERDSVVGETQERRVGRNPVRPTRADVFSQRGGGFDRYALYMRSVHSLVSTDKGLRKATSSSTRSQVPLSVPAAD